MEKVFLAILMVVGLVALFAGCTTQSPEETAAIQSPGETAAIQSPGETAVVQAPEEETVAVGMATISVFPDEEMAFEGRIIENARIREVKVRIIENARICEVK